MAKILLVEDDNNLREIYEARLQAEGYDIVSARDGEEALVVAKSEKPDLVISDIMMPKISGFEMLDILRNTPGLQDVKVIMLTALGQAEDQTRADKLGADRYLVKSQVTLEDIVRVSQELLGGATTPAASAPAASPTTDSTAPPPAPEPTSQPSSQPSSPTDPTPSIAVTAPPDEPAGDTTASNTNEVTAGQAQTASQEEAKVAKQIKDFETQPAAPAAEVQPDATSVAPVTPEVTTPETAPTQTSTQLGDGGPSSAASATPNQDSALDNAVDTLAASTGEASSGDPTPQPSSSGGVMNGQAAESTTDGSVTHKKVIEPPKDGGSPKKDIQQLLAEEEAKEAKASGGPATTSGSGFDPNSIAM